MQELRSPWFVGRWIALCGLGLAVGLVAALALSAPIEAVVGMILVTPIILGIAGTALGAGQWMALWTRPRVGIPWLVASAIGLAVGMTAGTVLVEAVGRAITGEQIRLLTVGPIARFIALAVIGAAAGFATGAAQGLTVRNQSAAWSRWVVWCTFGFAVALPVSGTVATLLPGGLQGFAGLATFLGGTGLLFGLLTVRPARAIETRL
jgi:hypothetical protein